MGHFVCAIETLTVSPADSMSKVSPRVLPALLVDTSIEPALSNAGPDAGWKMFEFIRDCLRL